MSVIPPRRRSNLPCIVTTHQALVALAGLAASACASGAAPRPEAPAVPAVVRSLDLPKTPSPGHHRMAAVQYEIRAGRPLDDVLTEIEVLATRAAEAGAELMVLPELFIFDTWASEVEDEPAYVRQVATDLTPVLLARAKDMADRLGIALLVGSVPELRGEALFNTAYLFFSDGRAVRQDKLFLTAWGKQVGMTPGRKLEVFDAPWGRSVILVCYDVEIPTLSARLVDAQPEVLLVPSMTESLHGYHRVRWSAQARAVEHHAYVVIAGTVGQPSRDWVHFGQAAFITPRDAGYPGVVAEGDFNEAELVIADLDLSTLRKNREKATFYPAKDVLQSRGMDPLEE